MYVSPKLQTVFKQYAEKLMDDNYLPKKPVEAMHAYITALWMLHGTDHPHAMLYLERAVHGDLKPDDLSAKTEKTSVWQSLQVCSQYSNICGQFVEYKLEVETDTGKTLIHRHIQCQESEHGFILMGEYKPWVRIIGDPILHKPGIPFPSSYTPLDLEALHQQIEIAKNRLIQTGGGGIAANQCAAIDKPYQFTIVGVFKDSEEHVKGVNRRYPDNSFPPAMVMLNPEIIAVSDSQQRFYHGCLSVPSSNRFEVASPEKMTIRYINPLDGMKPVTVTVAGDAAVAVWHELNHILDGKTYVDTVLSILDTEQLSQFAKLLDNEINSRKENEVLPNLSIEPYFRSIRFDSENQPRIDQDTLSAALTQMTEDTLIGLKKRCVQLLAPMRDNLFTGLRKQKENSPASPAGKPV